MRVRAGQFHHDVLDRLSRRGSLGMPGQLRIDGTRSRRLTRSPVRSAAHCHHEIDNDPGRQQPHPLFGPSRLREYLAETLTGRWRVRTDPAALPLTKRHCL